MHHLPGQDPRLLLTPAQTKELDDFAWRMRSLLGGDLFAILAQKPAWPSARLQRTLLNVLVITADLQMPKAEKLFQQYVVPNASDWRFPVDIVGYQDFAEKIELGDPTAIGLCLDGYVAYDSEGAFNRLRQKLLDPNHRIADNIRLHEYLANKRDAHYRNVGFLLARLLNEIYMATAAGLAHNLVAATDVASVTLLRDLSQWEQLKQRLPREQGRRYQDLVESMEKLLDDIILLLAGGEDDTGVAARLNYGQDILLLTEQLISDVSEK